MVSAEGGGIAAKVGRRGASTSSPAWEAAGTRDADRHPAHPICMYAVCPPILTKQPIRLIYDHSTMDGRMARSERAHSVPLPQEALGMSSSANRLRERLTADAWQILWQLPEPLTESVQTRAASESRVVSIQVGPPSSNGAAVPPSFPGLHFSAIEAAIWHALPATEAMLGKQIAKAIGQPYSSTLRTILTNLVDRQVLEHSRDGYKRKPCRSVPTKRATTEP